MKNKSKLLALITLLVSAFSFGQKVEFDRLLDKDGLVNSSINCIFRDSYGYIWIGTFNGLSRYDGYRFTNYINNPKNKFSINDNYISCITESSDSTLYIGFQYSGLCKYNRKTDTFTRFRHNPSDSNSVSDDNVLTIFTDKDRNIWIGNRNGIDRFDPVTSRFVHYRPKGNENYFVSSIVQDQDGNLWLYGRGDEICRFNPHHTSFDFFKYGNHSNNNISFNKSGTLMLDSRNNLWVSSPGVGLFRYNIKTRVQESFLEEDGKVKAKIISSVIEDSEGVIWIATDGAGIYRYRYSDNSLEILQHDPQDPYSLSTNAIYCVYQSQPGTVWIGTYASGVNIYKKYKNKFLKYTSVGSPGKCLSQKSVLSIKETEDGKIWLGTDGGGLNLLDPKTGSFKYYTTKNSIIHSDIITGICIDSRKNLWIGSFGRSLGKVNFETGESRVYKGNLHARGETILNQHAWTVIESFDKKIWVGLLDYGVNVYDPDKDIFTYYPYDSVAFSKAYSNIYTLFEDSRHRMWIGTETIGAGYYDPDKKTFKRYVYEHDKADGLSSNDIRDIFEDSRGNIWIATFKGGLNRLLDADKGIFKIYDVDNGLPTNNIQSILEDDHHNLWLSTDKGITLFKTEENKIINFDTEDGLQSNTFNYNAAYKDKKGYMYFGGINGLNVFHPDSIYFNHNPPPVTLTDFKLFNKSILPGQKINDRVYLEEAIDVTKEITLTYEDYIFSLEFAALDMTAPRKNKYAYRLLGLNDQWTYVDADKRFAIYTNLNPGEYTFQVIATNNDGVWNNKGTFLRIKILPPWWLTWWFKTIAAAALIFTFWLIYYIRMQSVKAKNMMLEQEVKKRTYELKEANDSLNARQLELESLNRTKDKFFSIISHDLKGPIRALTSLTGLLKEETEKEGKLKTLAQHIDTSTNKVQTLLLSLLEWARTQTGAVKLDPVMMDVRKVFMENKDLLSNQAFQKNIEIKVEAAEEHSVYADYNMVTTIVRNILSNSIKYTPRGGCVSLSSELTTDGYVKLLITDNGIGMSNEVLSKLFTLEKGPSVKGTDNELGTGLGMIIAKEFAELNGGYIYAESQPGIGSTFYLVLPDSTAGKMNINR